MTLTMSVSTRCMIRIWSGHVAGGGGWSLICQPHNDDFEDEPILIGEMVIGLITETEQEEGVEIIRNDKMRSSASE